MDQELALVGLSGFTFPFFNGAAEADFFAGAAFFAAGFAVFFVGISLNFDTKSNK